MPITEFVVCDLCGTVKKKSFTSGHAMINYGQSYQKWPSNTGEKEYYVCDKCCKIIFMAKLYGLLDYDEVHIYTHSGYVMSADGLWTEKE